MQIPALPGVKTALPCLARALSQAPAPPSPHGCRISLLSLDCLVPLPCQGPLSRSLPDQALGPPLRETESHRCFRHSAGLVQVASGTPCTGCRPPPLRHWVSFCGSISFSCPAASRAPSGPCRQGSGGTRPGRSGPEPEELPCTAPPAPPLGVRGPLGGLSGAQAPLPASGAPPGLARREEPAAHPVGHTRVTQEGSSGRRAGRVQGLSAGGFAGDPRA